LAERGIMAAMGQPGGPEDYRAELIRRTTARTTTLRLAEAFMNQAAVDTIAALPLDYWVEGCQCVVNADGDLRTDTCPHHPQAAASAG
jgi:hypothetical protein